MLLNQRLVHETNKVPQSFRQSAPNGLFRMLEHQNITNNKPVNQSNNLSIIFDESLQTPLDHQLRVHISHLHQQVSDMKRAEYHFHFVRSLRYHGEHLVSNPNDFNSFTDYIQFGLATA